LLWTVYHGGFNAAARPLYSHEKVFINLQGGLCLLAVRPDGSGDGFSCHLVPIDACYELVGRMRRLWRGFDGGSEARAAMADFFSTVQERSRPAQEAL